MGGVKFPMNRLIKRFIYTTRLWKDIEMLRKLTIVTLLSLLGFASIAGAADKKVIIGFKKNSGISEENKHNKFYRSGGRIKRSHKMINAVSGQLPEEEIEKLKKDPTIAFIEADVVVGITQPISVAPLLTQEYNDSWGVTTIGGNAAVAAGITGAGIKVAILDSGIDYNHPDLKDNYKGGYNFAYDNNDPFDDGYISHGTHIAGIIGARNNGTGVVGVAPEVSLYAVKVLGGMVMGDLSDILAGMEWAIFNKMDIINMSIGAPIDSAAFQDACDRAYQAGIIVVAASGNTNSNYIEFPAAYDSVIAVSATDQDNSRAIFSNYAPKNELAAPGVNINSTMRGGGYGIMKGTSQAAAHVSGAAALMLASKIIDRNGDGRVADDVRALLDATATDLGVPGRDDSFGFGLVNLNNALIPPAPLQWEYNITKNHTNHNSQNLEIPFKGGNYVLDVTLNDMRELDVIVKDSSGARYIEFEKKNHPLRRKYPFQIVTSNSSTATIKIETLGSLTFIPKGRSGSSAKVVVTAK